MLAYIAYREMMKMHFTHEYALKTHVSNSREQLNSMHVYGGDSSCKEELRTVGREEDGLWRCGLTVDAWNYWRLTGRHSRELKSTCEFCIGCGDHHVLSGESRSELHSDNLKIDN